MGKSEKQDYIRVILPLRGEKAFFQPSHVWEILSSTGSQNEVVLGFPPKMRPKYEGVNLRLLTLARLLN